MRRAALEKGDELALGLLMNKNFELRRRIFGDAALGALNLAMIKCAWSVNGAFSQQSCALMSTCILQLHSIEDRREYGAHQRAGSQVRDVRLALGLLPVV